LIRAFHDFKALKTFEKTGRQGKGRRCACQYKRPIRSETPCSNALSLRGRPPPPLLLTGAATSMARTKTLHTLSADKLARAGKFIDQTGQSA
jgi:hypothetical protein